MSTDAIDIDPADAPDTASTRYSPLPRDGDSFRLLRVLPNRKTDSPLQCELYTASISREANQYIAGSYVWGPPEPTKSVLLDGAPFQVRENLFRFLRAFRSRHHPQVIWLDAVCINQDDIQERSHQVREMKRIYSCAKYVYCWLGYDNPLPHTSIFDRRRLIDMYYWCKRDRRQYTRQRNQLYYITQAGYWSRMWIVQEFILAKEPVLLLGTEKISYRQLHSIVRGWRGFGGSDANLQTKIVSFMNSRVNRGRFEALFNQYGMMPRSMPQDGVFALLGLVGSREVEMELVGMIDYSLTVWQLLQRILAPNILKWGPFRFTERYNRYVIQGQKDKYMGSPIHVELDQTPRWETPGPDEPPLRSSEDAYQYHVYERSSDTHLAEITTYAAKRHTISEQSGVSVRLSYGFVPVSKSVRTTFRRSSTCAIIEGCDSRCTTTCVTHAILGFSWRFYNLHVKPSGPVLRTPMGSPLFDYDVPSHIHELKYTMQQKSMEIVEAVSEKVRVGVVKRYTDVEPLYRLETDLETMVKLSTFIREPEWSYCWPEFMDLAMDRCIRPGTQENVADLG